MTNAQNASSICATHFRDLTTHLLSKSMSSGDWEEFFPDTRLLPSEGPMRRPSDSLHHREGDESQIVTVNASLVS